jgi:hypothetical protein
MIDPIFGLVPRQVLASKLLAAGASRRSLELDLRLQRRGGFLHDRRGPLEIIDDLSPLPAGRRRQKRALRKR